MRKIIAIYTLTLIVYHGLAQTPYYGISAGVNYTHLPAQNYNLGDLKYKFGFQANAIIGLNFSNQLGIRTEPGFVNRGARIGYIKLIGSNSYYTYNYLNLNYINIPVLFSYSPMKKLALLIGPECSFRLNSSSNTNPEFDSKMDFGLHTGMSYRVIDKIEIGLQYYKGFISTVNNVELTDINGISVGKANLHNQGLAFTVAYMIR